MSSETVTTDEFKKALATMGTTEQGKEAGKELTIGQSVWNSPDKMKQMGNNRHPREWQYSWEALSHLRTLRLYLFHSSVSPQDRCSEISVSLRPRYTHFNGLCLLIKWAEPDGVEGHSLPVLLRVPVPPVVLDHSAPIQVRAMPDHIEVKLMLMLPVDHPLVGSLSSLLQADDDPCQKEQQENQSSFSLDNDTLMLASEGEIHFYCKNCSAKLTKEPLRSFLELPSVDWREVADNWFGTCCCSFGGVSESLVANFEKFSTISKGTCFVGSTSLTIHMGELAEDAIIECGSGIVPGSGTFTFPEKLNKIAQSGVKDDALVQSKKYMTGKEFEWLSSHNVMERNVALITIEANVGERIEEKERNINSHLVNSGSFLEKASSEIVSSITDQETETVARAEKCVVATSRASDCAIPSLWDTHSLGSAADFTSQPLEERLIRLSMLEDPIENGKGNCCNADSGPMTDSYDGLTACKTRTSLVCCNEKDSKSPSLLDQRPSSSSEPQLERKNTFGFYLGNGFMMGPSGVSKTVEWVALHCSACSSLVGSYPHANNRAISDDESIQLFKCHISTSEVVGGSRDVFRKHTLQRMFVNLLQARAENEASYRTVVRDLKTKVPMLQMVFLNANAWFCSGSCQDCALPGEDAINTEKLVEEPAVLEDGSRGLDGTNSRASGPSNAVGIKRHSCTYLQPVVKVSFRDCSSHATKESRLIEDWALQKDAEDIYMLREEIMALTEALLSVKFRLPESCRSLQSFYLSFLEK